MFPVCIVSGIEHFERHSYYQSFFLLSFLGFEVGKAEQHARQWLWQYIQWLRDGWFRVRDCMHRVKLCHSPKWKTIFSHLTLSSQINHCFVLKVQMRQSWGCGNRDQISVFSCSVGRRGRLRSSGWLGEGTSIPELDDLELESDPTLPSTEDVIRKTEQITKNIQELLRAAQENKHDRSGPRGDGDLCHFIIYFYFLASRLVL